MTVLLDTCVIIDALKAKFDRHVLLRELASRGETLACCAINVAEVYAGMRPNEETATAGLLATFEFIEVGRDLSERAGRLKFEWERKGRTIHVPDAIIAAVALTFDLSLATDNRRDFPMPDLQFLDLPAKRVH
jgi:predicted nucleic acid-binding protein